MPPCAHPLTATHAAALARAETVPGLGHTTGADLGEVLLDQVWQGWDPVWTATLGAGHGALLRHRSSGEWAVLHFPTQGWPTETQSDAARRRALTRHTQHVPVATTLIAVMDAATTGLCAAHDHATRASHELLTGWLIGPVAALAINECGLPDATQCAVLIALGGFGNVRDELAELLANAAEDDLHARFATTVQDRFHTLTRHLSHDQCARAWPDYSSACWTCERTMTSFGFEDDFNLDQCWDPTTRTPTPLFDTECDQRYYRALHGWSNGDGLTTLVTVQMIIDTVAATIGVDYLGFWENTTLMLGPGWRMAGIAPITGASIRADFVGWVHDSGLPIGGVVCWDQQPSPEHWAALSPNGRLWVLSRVVDGLVLGHDFPHLAECSAFALRDLPGMHAHSFDELTATAWALMDQVSLTGPISGAATEHPQVGAIPAPPAGGTTRVDHVLRS